jgi:serine/threonine protein kinase
MRRRRQLDNINNDPTNQMYTTFSNNHDNDHDYNNNNNIQMISNDKSEDLNLHHRLGEGSFGAVYMALHQPTGATVAVKIIPNAGGTASEDEKIKGEIDILSRCDSPYIVGYFECFIKPPSDVKPGEMWIVMEYCEGGSMTDLIEASGGFNLPEDCIRGVCASIVLGLEYLHGVANVCHRDIKCGVSCHVGLSLLESFCSKKNLKHTTHISCRIVLIIECAHYQ